jgi:hypothetical protein
MIMYVKKHLFSVSLIVVGLLVGCGGREAVESTDLPLPSATAVPPTNTPAPPTHTSTVTATRTTTPTATPEGPINASVSVGVLNLRSGPGTVHLVVGNLAEGIIVSAVGRAPGDEWVKVLVGEDQYGWLYAPLLDFEKNYLNLPELPITESLIVQGRVTDSQGNPIQGIGITVSQTLTDAGGTTQATSNSDGYFYAYLPPESYGSWDVQITGIDCTSLVVNEDCDLNGYFPVQDFFLVPLPQKEAVIFVFEIATMAIEGIVEDNGSPVRGVRVYAERADGARSYTDSGDDGVFSLPASDGEWEVYTVTFNPYRVGEGVDLTISDGVQSDELVVPLP